MEKGAVRIYYGEGHGKTNVAIGSAICAACEGRTAIIIQFLKGKNEQEFLSRLEPEVKFFNFSNLGNISLCFVWQYEYIFISLPQKTKKYFDYGKRNGYL